MPLLLLPLLLPLLSAFNTYIQHSTSIPAVAMNEAEIMLIKAGFFHCLREGAFYTKYSIHIDLYIESNRIESRISYFAASISLAFLLLPSFVCTNVSYMSNRIPNLLLSRKYQPGFLLPPCSLL